MLNLKKHSILYAIPDSSKVSFISILKEFAKSKLAKTEFEAEQFANEKFDLLIRGFDFLGNKTIANLHFDELVEKETNNFYVPDLKNRKRYKKTEVEKIKKEIKQSIKIENSDLAAKAEKYKADILKEYPNLSRKDTMQTLDTYCSLVVQSKDLVAMGVQDNSRELKELIDIIIKLGGYLGIDEGEKKKEKDARNRQSIADMSVHFQDTLEEMPELKDRWKYMELVMLLNKLERQELTKTLFESADYAGMKLEDARIFVSERRSQYD